MINCLNWFGVCENYSTIYNVRKWLASVDELLVQKQAAWGVTHIIFDNLDLYIKNLHHLTLPILMFELYPTFHLSHSDAVGFEETLALFSRDFLDLSAERNVAEKEHFLFVIKTVLANDICSGVKDLKWVKDFFDKHHKHKHSDTASSRSTIHIDPPMALDEKKTTDMTLILENFVDRYLNLLSERLSGDEKEKFVKNKKIVKEWNSSEPELRSAEAHLLEVANQFGFLIIHGDLLR